MDGHNVRRSLFRPRTTGLENARRDGSKDACDDSRQVCRTNPVTLRKSEMQYERSEAQTKSDIDVSVTATIASVR